MFSFSRGTTTGIVLRCHHVNSALIHSAYLSKPFHSLICFGELLSVCVMVVAFNLKAGEKSSFQMDCSFIKPSVFISKPTLQIRNQNEASRMSFLQKMGYKWPYVRLSVHLSQWLRITEKPLCRAPKEAPSRMSTGDTISEPTVWRQKMVKLRVSECSSPYIEGAHTEQTLRP